MKYLLAFVLCFATIIPGCAFFQEQRTVIETMSQTEYEQLVTDVSSYGVITGRQFSDKLTPEQKLYLKTAVSVIFAESNEKRGRKIADLLENPEYRDLLRPLIAGVLDLVEAAIGDRLELQSLGFTDRENGIVKGAFDGFILGIHAT